MKDIYFDFSLFLALLVKVSAAWLLTFPISVERARDDMSAGLRTFPVVAAASCGLVLLAGQVFGINSDQQTHILQGLVTGIGFIGGGAIVREGSHVRGTATAAAVWSTGIIGAAVGYGRFEIALVLSAATTLTLYCITQIERRQGLRGTGRAPAHPAGHSGGGRRGGGRGRRRSAAGVSGRTGRRRPGAVDRPHRMEQPLATTGPTADALGRALEREFTTSTDRVIVGMRELDILRPRNSDDLISEADYVRDERLPYWADLWPAALILASFLLESPVPERADRPAPRLLELGCGLGLVTTAALWSGYDVTAVDYYADALRFTQVNAWRAVHRLPTTELVDWRAFPADLGQFRRVVAADVLYERSYAPLIAAAIAATLAPGGAAIIADPGRIAAPAFLDSLPSHGLALSDTTVRPYDEGAIHQKISLYTVRWAPGT